MWLVACPRQGKLHYSLERKATNMADEVTSEDEPELMNVRRPKRGEGWWGLGPSLLPLRKGVPRPFTDGAGLCSPGRWPFARRRLPSSDLALKLQDIVYQGLVSFERRIKMEKKPRDLRHLTPIPFTRTSSSVSGTTSG